MKRSDIMVVLFMASAGIVIAYFLCNAMMPKIEPVTFTTIAPISMTLEDPDSEVFNSGAINPTVETYVGSCVDQDQDGELDLAESVLCHEAGNDSDMDEEKSQDAKDVLNEVNKSGD